MVGRAYRVRFGYTSFIFAAVANLLYINQTMSTAAQMSSEEAYDLGDDLPKQNPWQEDRLGFKPFAERLAKVITTLSAPNGYVIGLHGEWGSGKSTAINFVREFLKKHNQEMSQAKDAITLVDFQPWIVAG